MHTTTRRILATALLATIATTATILPTAAATGTTKATVGTTTTNPTTTLSLQNEVNAVTGTGVTGVIAEVTNPRNRQYATSGVGNTQTETPVPPNGEIRIGSITKTFVATVILQLVGEGCLSLDDPIDRWLPGVVSGNGNDGTRITVRELLQHTSGLYDYVLDLPQFASTTAFQAGRFTTYTADQLVNLAMRHAPNFAPGTGWSYSNTNYALAGMIINRVTGRSWQQEATARVIDPLGLRHTVAPGTFPFITGPHAEGYSNFGSGPAIDVTVLNPSATDAAGSMVSTSADLSRFFAALIGGRLLAPAQLREMETTVPAPEFGVVWPGVRYGLGLMWVPLSCGGGYFSHGGDLPGYHTRDGSTADARHIVVVSATGDGDSASGGLNSEHAIDSLIDHQLCDSNHNQTG